MVGYSIPITKKARTRRWLFNWISDFAGLIECLSGIVTFTLYYPQLTTKLDSWEMRTRK